MSRLTRLTRMYRDAIGGAGVPATAAAPLPALQQRTRRLELVAGLLWAGSLAILELGPALAKKAYHASDIEVALLTSGQSAGLMLSFFTTHLAARCSRVRLAFWLHLLSNLALVPVFFLRPGFALAFVALHALARIGHAMAIPARVLVYRTNFPVETRGGRVGELQRVKLVLTTFCALLLSVLLDWNTGTEELVAILGPCPVPADDMVRWVIPAFAVLGLLGTFVYGRIEEPADSTDGTRGESAAPPPAARAHTLRRTMGEFLRVWREDHAFRRYETFFFIFGFTNIMSIPLTQIHAVDRLGASYFDLAMINVCIVQGLMALTMVAWGNGLDRTTPSRLRGILNLVLAVDFLALALAPSIGWVYAGRTFRGIALGGGALVWMLGPLWFARDSSREPIYTGIHAFLTGVRWGIAPFAAVGLKALCGGDARPIFILAAAILVVIGTVMIRDGGRGRRRHDRPGGALADGAVLRSGCPGPEGSSRAGGGSCSHP